MSHCDNHNHDHNHHNSSKGLLLVLFLTVLYMFAEFFGGLYTNSLALMADAGHMLGDVGSLFLSYFAIWLSLRPAPPEKTFGYFRAEIFAAFINGVTLIIISLFIIYDAYLRLLSPPEIKSVAMIIIATGGLVVNLIGVLLLHKDSKENLNIKGAFLHIVGDLLGSVGAVLAGILILVWKFYIADPIISFVIAGFILYSSINLINSAVQVIMETAPSHIDVNEVKNAIIKVENVINVHDLHIWNIDSKMVSISVHIVAKIEHSSQLLCNVDELLKDKFNISHSTIQIEPEDFHTHGCPLNLH
jgi:cobalt-zinc-cadmium efflux system protein